MFTILEKILCQAHMKIRVVIHISHSCFIILKIIYLELYYNAIKWSLISPGFPWNHFTDVIWRTAAITGVPLFQFEKSSRLSREAEDQLKVIPKFCFPDSLDWKPSAHMPRSAHALQTCFNSMLDVYRSNCITTAMTVAKW